MSMPRPVASRSWQDFKAHLLEAVNRWRRDGLPGRWRLLRDLEELEALRKAIPASQTPPSEIFPLLYLATIDDGWGHGLEVIEAAARAAGARTVRLGLLCSAESILAPCAQKPPHILGLTILHGDSEPVVREIVRGLPPNRPNLGRRGRFHMGSGLRPKDRDPRGRRRCGRLSSTAVGATPVNFFQGSRFFRCTSAIPK